MGTIVGMFAGKTLFGKVISEPMARAIAYGLLALLLLASFAVGKCAYDRSVIAHHDAKQQLQQEKINRKADSQAAEQRRSDDAREVQERHELEKVTSHAQTDTDRRLAFHRCLRLQQQARERGKQPPACS